MGEEEKEEEIELCTYLGQVLDSNIKDQPLVPARVRGGGDLRGKLLSHQQLSTMVDPRLNVDHFNVRVTKVVQPYHTDPEGGGGGREEGGRGGGREGRREGGGRRREK